MLVQLPRQIQLHTQAGHMISVVNIIASDVPSYASYARRADSAKGV